MELGLGEMILIGLVLLVFFGPKKLPEIGGSIGKAIRDFKKTLSDTTSDLRDHVEATEHPAVNEGARALPASSEASKAEEPEHVESAKSLPSVTSDRSS